MNTARKLIKIQKAGRKTQQELANLLGVSFPTVNSWINGKSKPRKKQLLKIEELYGKYLGSEEVDQNLLSEKYQQINDFQEIFPNPLEMITSRRDLYELFVLELTYHTNSIEGSTFSEPEVRAVLFNNTVFADKTVVEHQEAKNHQAALGNLLSYLVEGGKTVDEAFILKMHQILMNGIWPNSGEYRQHPVRIGGSHVITANYVKVPTLVREFAQTMAPKSTADIEKLISHIAKKHAEFEQIHPFSDGNGRVGRLIMSAQSLLHNLPPILIPQDRKYVYYEYLERAQLTGNSLFLESFICECIVASYKLLT